MGGTHCVTLKLPIISISVLLALAWIYLQDSSFLYYLALNLPRSPNYFPRALTHLFEIAISPLPFGLSHFLFFSLYFWRFFF